MAERADGSGCDVLPPPAPAGRTGAAARLDPSALGPAGGGGSRRPERGRRVLAQLTGELYRTGADPKQRTDAQRAWLPGTATAAVVAAGARARRERQLQGGGREDGDDPAAATSLQLPSEAAAATPVPRAAGTVTVLPASIATAAGGEAAPAYRHAHGRLAAFQAPPKPSRQLRPARGVFADE
jgi:hypothetical protein